MQKVVRKIVAKIRFLLRLEKTDCDTVIKEYLEKIK